MDPLKKAQAATELAVFGAILIFLLGTIIRSAVGNGLTQNQNFNAMRMAMLSSWVDSRNGNPSHNSPSLLIVEDQLSPDFNKYGDLDRNAYETNGGGSFTYELLYPVNESEVNAYLPIMDVWINGQHFPFTTASFNSASFSPSTQGITEPGLSCSGSGYSYQSPSQIQQTCSSAPNQQQCQINTCQQNQCFRDQREWIHIDDSQGNINYYKLFFVMEPNAGQLGDLFAVVPPALASCATLLDPLNNCTALITPSAYLDKALTSGLILSDGETNTNGDMEYDLLRTGQLTAVDEQFPLTQTNDSCPVASLRCNIAWQWDADVAAIAGSTTDGADPQIALNPDNNEYPVYDIDGRLKEVTIYAVSGPSNTTSQAITAVSFEDFQGGDIDSTWDSNTCGPKPGLQTGSEMYTFTGDGTYLQIKEGQLYNPQTGQVVSSVNKRNNIDVVQRTIQLSNNTGRFCQNTGGTWSPQPCVASCTLPSGMCTTPSQMGCSPTSDPNPVEACVDGVTNNCFNGSNIALTCFDTSNNMLYVRSRIQDLRGRSWMTNAAGQLQVR